MRYFYISRNEMKMGNIVVYDTFNIEVPLEAYRTAPGKEDAIQYIGENIPNDIEYDVDNDVLYSAGDRPSPYHVFVKGIWIVKDLESYKKYCDENVENIKTEVLDNGFDYNGHKQRCRDKDIIFISIATLLMYLTHTFLHITISPKWYFKDNYYKNFSLLEMIDLMFNGYKFVQSVYDAEHYFKTQSEVKFITKEDFENKRSEIYATLNIKSQAIENTLISKGVEK